MQLNISTDYAIRAMLFLAIHGRGNAAEISEEMVVPLNTCKKNLQLLKKADLIKSYAGIKGGYGLNKEAKDIRIVDILDAVGENHKFNRCLECDEYCNRQGTDTCQIRKIYQKAQQALDEAFSWSLQDIIDSDK
ncbi:MAG: Rrf2 family transcriptional regulator [Anaerovoracaceae bacterium]